MKKISVARNEQGKGFVVKRAETFLAPKGNWTSKPEQALVFRAIKKAQQEAAMRQKAESGQPFVTKKVIGLHMIQRYGNQHDAKWLTPDGTWHGSVFEAAGFPNKRAAKHLLADLLAA